MNLRTLGHSDLEITPIGIGAWAIDGGRWEFGWGPQDDKQSVDAIRAGLDRGINWIDTMAAYGLGHSETVVGKAVKGRADVGAIERGERNVTLRTIADTLGVKIHDLVKGM